MQAGIFNLIEGSAIEQGSDFSFSLVYKDVDGNPIDLTGAVITADIKEDWNSTAVASFTISTNEPATDGVITLSIPADDTSSVSPNRYKYDVRVEMDGNVSRIIKGVCDIVESITFA